MKRCEHCGSVIHEPLVICLDCIKLFLLVLILLAIL